MRLHSNKYSILIGQFWNTITKISQSPTIQTFFQPIIFYDGLFIARLQCFYIANISSAFLHVHMTLLSFQTSLLNNKIMSSTNHPATYKSIFLTIGWLVGWFIVFNATTIFQLYRGEQLYWWRTRRTSPNCRWSLTNFIT